MKCWCTMPMPAAIASPGPVKVHRLAVDQDLALVGLVEPVEDVHQGGLAGAVLAEQRVDLARLDVRSIASLATSVPKRLVMPRSSSFTGDLLVDGTVGRPADGARRSGERRSPSRGVPRCSAAGRLSYLGWLGEVTLIVPLMMSALTLSSSALRSAGTLLSKSWYGARPMPLFFRCRCSCRSGRCRRRPAVTYCLHRVGEVLGDAGEEVLAVLRGARRSRRCRPRSR